MTTAHIPGCTGKVKHATETGARDSAVRTAKKFGRPAHAYPCPFCGCWHVSTLRGERARRDAAKRERMQGGRT